jgi:hypothetical protein
MNLAKKIQPLSGFAGGQLVSLPTVTHAPTGSSSTTTCLYFKLFNALYRWLRILSRALKRVPMASIATESSVTKQ